MDDSIQVQPTVETPPEQPPEPAPVKRHRGPGRKKGSKNKPRTRRPQNPLQGQEPKGEIPDLPPVRAIENKEIRKEVVFEQREGDEVQVLATSKGPVGYTPERPLVTDLRCKTCADVVVGEEVLIEGRNPALVLGFENNYTLVLVRPAMRSPQCDHCAIDPTKLVKLAGGMGLPGKKENKA